jgi:hypothetical protein
MRHALPAFANRPDALAEQSEPVVSLPNPFAFDSSADWLKHPKLGNENLPVEGKRMEFVS